MCSTPSVNVRRECRGWVSSSRHKTLDAGSIVIACCAHEQPSWLKFLKPTMHIPRSLQLVGYMQGSGMATQRLTWLAVAEAPHAPPALVACVDAQRGVAHGACVDGRQVTAVYAEALEQRAACGAGVVPGAVAPAGACPFA